METFCSLGPCLQGVGCDCSITAQPQLQPHLRVRWGGLPGLLQALVHIQVWSSSTVQLIPDK